MSVSVNEKAPALKEEIEESRGIVQMTI